MATNAEVFKYLDTLDFPAGKEDILAEAERLGAPHGVQQALRALPPVVYANRDEVIRSAGTELAPEEDAAERAARVRNKVRQQVTEFLRQPP
jgi:hypothetical protein